MAQTLDPEQLAEELDQLYETADAAYQAGDYERCESLLRDHFEQLDATIRQLRQEGGEVPVPVWKTLTRSFYGLMEFYRLTDQVEKNYQLVKARHFRINTYVVAMERRQRPHYLWERFDV